MLKRGCLLVAVAMLALASASALAQATTAVRTAPSADQEVSPAAKAMVSAVIAKLSAAAQVDSVQPAPLAGFYQVISSGRLLYISVDGRYVVSGELFDLSSMHNVSEDAWARYRRQALAKVPRSERIVFAPAHPRYTVSVFTDITCPFCEKLHKQIAAFNAAGIAVEYLAWPRDGVTTTSGQPTPTYTNMVSVWCAKDRKAALTAAMSGAVKPAMCANPVKAQFNLGVKLGVNGTPSVIGPDGHVLGGYLTPEQLLVALRHGD
ncbi:MAG: DsbC family protein [Rhodanobacter sp.]